MVKQKKHKNYILPISLIVFVLTSMILFILFSHNGVLNNINNPNYDDDIKLGDITIYYSAANASYSGVDSGISAVTVQEAIEAIYDAISSDCYVGYTKGTTTSDTYICNKNTSSGTPTIDIDGIEIKFDNHAGLVATNVEDAIGEIANYVNYCADGYYKTNETSTSYECYAMCHVMVEKNVTYGSYKSCTASCPTTTGRQYRDVYHHMYSSYDNSIFCETQTVTNGDYKSCSISCGYWYYTDDYTDPWGKCGCGASYCPDNMFCKKKCELHGWSGTWACTTSGSDRPTSASQSTGGHCWYWRT